MASLLINDVMNLLVSCQITLSFTTIGDHASLSAAHFPGVKLSISKKDFDQLASLQPILNLQTEDILLRKYAALSTSLEGLSAADKWCCASDCEEKGSALLAEADQEVTARSRDLGPRCVVSQAGQQSNSFQP